MSGILKLAEALPQSKLERLKCAAPQLHVTVHHHCPPRQRPMTCHSLISHLVLMLSLRDNLLGPQGGVAIAEGLKGNATLASLE